MATFYGTDLAYVHHVGFRAVPEAAARWLVRYLAAHRVPEGLLVDLGCGSGVFAAAVRSTGRPVLGIDVSPAMLALAKRMAPQARFRRGSIHSARLPDCAIATIIGEGLSYVPPGGRLPPLTATFRRIGRSLRPGGLLLFDLITGPMDRLVPRRGFQLGPDWAVLSETRPLRRSDRFTRHSTTFREIGGCYRRSVEVHGVQVYDRRRVAEALRAAGFRVRTSSAFDPSTRLPGRTVFAARRRPGRPRS